MSSSLFVSPILITIHHSNHYSSILSSLLIIFTVHNKQNDNIHHSAWPPLTILIIIHRCVIIIIRSTCSVIHYTWKWFLSTYYKGLECVWNRRWPFFVFFVCWNRTIAKLCLTIESCLMLTKTHLWQPQMRYISIEQCSHTPVL